MVRRYGAQSASRRTSSSPRGRRWSTRSSTGCCGSSGELGVEPPRPPREPALRRVALSRRTEEALPLASPVIGPEEEARVLAALRSGRLSLGPLLPEFERAFAERVRAPFASAVSSGTAGLHLALRAVGVSEGDEVITSPFSFVASANVAVYERARPVFADIDPVTLNLDVDAAAAAVTDRTSALLPVHVFGYPADIAGFERLRLPIVEDACEALGAVYGDGRTVGSRGHPAVFAFYANKQMTTGEGGMITLSDAAMKERIDSE